MPINQPVALADLKPHPRNYNAHSAAQVAKIAASLTAFGQVRSIVVWRGTILAGHGVVLAARSLGWAELRADVVDELDEARALAYVAADNELARQSDPDLAQLAAILQESRDADPALLLAIGYTDGEFAALLREVGADAAGVGDGLDDGGQVDRAAELNEVWKVQPGDMFSIGQHRLICGDCREPFVWMRLLDGVKVNGVFTSPPYAEQRKAQYGGTPTAEYVDWWEAVQANVKANLAADGSFFVNIKPHCEDGERVLYVFDLVLAMKRRWGWKYVDELCWTHEDLPGAWPNRFRNGFEPVYQFSPAQKIKFHPMAVGKPSDAVRDGIGGLQKRDGGNWTLDAPLVTGIAQPSNVIRAGGNTDTVSHAAAFPVALPDFFIRAYSDPADIWLDPFLGSGTTMVAAHNNKRVGMGIEMLPNYCAVILQRMADAFPGIVIERIPPHA
jgi:DNA modification methylase